MLWLQICSHLKKDLNLNKYSQNPESLFLLEFFLVLILILLKSGSLDKRSIDSKINLSTYFGIYLRVA